MVEAFLAHGFDGFGAGSGGGDGGDGFQTESADRGGLEGGFVSVLGHGFAAEVGGGGAGPGGGGLSRGWGRGEEIVGC